MTRPFNAHITCPHCYKRLTNESAFGRWMRAHPALDSVHGIVRTDLDHAVLRYKTSLQGRDFQLMQVIEAKEWGKEPDPSQVDILSYIRQAASPRGVNMHDARTIQTIKVHSKMFDRMVNLRFYGVQLLQFEKTNPRDGRIWWNRREIDEGTLLGLLAMERDPLEPDTFIMEKLRDRHHQRQLRLFAA